MQPPWIPDDQWALLVQYAAQYDSYPEVYAAIGWEETHWGQLGAGRQGYLLGVGVPNADTELPQFRGLRAQLDWTAPRIQQVVDRHPSYAAFLAYAQQYQRPANPAQWAANVWAIYQQLGPPTEPSTTASGTTPGPRNILAPSGMTAGVPWLPVAALLLAVGLLWEAGHQVGEMV